MSYRGLLKHRCHILRLVEAETDGSPIHVWEQITEQPQRCFMDLGFIRPGKDPVWTHEAGRPGDRTGVCFLMGDAPIKSGDRIKMVKGPLGTFKVEMAVDEAWKPDRRHHLEVGVQEVPPIRSEFAREESDG